MRNIIYLECYSGISGDMLVAALLDLGADETVLRKALASLPVTGFEVTISRVKKNGLDACDFTVILDKEHENHDHDMAYLHGEVHSHSQEGGEQHCHAHAGDDGQSCIHTAEEKHSHSHTHRNLQEIVHIIQQSSITDAAKAIAVRIFHILAEAESKAHGVSVEEVHFHEVGAIDSIVDIVAIAVCMDNLNIQEVIVPSLYEGCGFVRCQHGMIPVPVPAVLHIANQYGLQLHMTDIQGEFVTPTGAAAVAALQTTDKLPDRFCVRRCGIGAGKRKYERPSLLRAMLIEKTEETDSDVIWKLESNIDDCSGEVLGYCMERLFAAGARDVHYMPVFMKKNRPAYQLNVIAKEEDIPLLEQIIFEETTTIGIRKICMERTILPRRISTIMTPLGNIKVKICDWDGKRHIYPEYESVAEKAREHHMPYRQVYDTAVKHCIDAE